MILVLGGTGEARELARLLQESGVRFESSLAGRVARPRMPEGAVRIGGFGGVDGLRAHLRNAGVTAVVDATHPFAAGITRNAAVACAAEGVPLLRLERPGWTEHQAAASWHWVDDHAAAALAAAALGSRPFLTVGRQSLARFTGPLGESDALVRVVDAPDVELPPRWTVLHSRGPYDAASERELMDRHGVDVVVTKDSGGKHTVAKLDVAARLDVPVVVVSRPPSPAGIATTPDVEASVAWSLRHDL
ncbi:cobalt-precorrin-6A reductase [Aeromicrobium sp. CF4.19]|uniref:cobalt-precorrin-6A reductase n=1 Tax=Aeromicrobium sp. CF4.19 TaxID=3373082 RepID=UPI003EE55F84